MMQPAKTWNAPIVWVIISKADMNDASPFRHQQRFEQPSLRQRRSIRQYFLYLHEVFKFPFFRRAAKNRHQTLLYFNHTHP